MYLKLLLFIITYVKLLQENDFEHEDKKSSSSHEGLMSCPTSFSKKSSHLYPLYCKYAEILSDEAKKFLILDFNLENEFYKNPDLTKDDDIRNIIVNGNPYINY